MNIIVHLANCRWTADNVPCPSVEKIAKALGVTSRTIQKRIKRLSELKFITREERCYTKHGSITNNYRFDGLIAAATRFAEEKIKQIAAMTEAKNKRIASKKPHLKLITTGE